MNITRRMLHQWVALIVSLVAIGAYALFVGPSPPVVRAALMGSLLILARLVGRKPHALTSLAASSALMTLYNPLLLWSVSFQLSFAASLGLLLLEPALEGPLRDYLATRWGRDRAKRVLRVLRDLLLATVAAQLATLPIIWHHFGQVSVISLLANALVLSAQPAIMILGFGATAIGFLSEPLGRMVAWLVWPFLRYTIGVVQGLGALPWAALDVPRAHPLVIWLPYVALVFWHPLRQRLVLRIDWRKVLGLLRVKDRLLTVLGLLMVLVWAGVVSLPDGRLHVYFLDVGQGDALLLRTPGGRVILVDGGPDPLLLTSRVGQILPFWQRRIDLVVATHEDQDHLAGLLPLVERYRVERVLQAPSMAGGALSQHWHELLGASATELLWASRGMSIELGDSLRIDVLHPKEDAAPRDRADDNRNSVVLRVTMDAFQMLLTADIDGEAEAELIRSGLPLAATVLKVAHHGAESSTSEQFLAAVNPQIAVISVGADNRFGHPSTQVLDRLLGNDCRVYRTDRHGTVEIITDGRSYWLRSGR